MDVTDIILVFAQRSGLDISLSPGGTLALNFEHGTTLNLEHDIEEDVLHLYSVVGDDPPDDATRLALYRDILEANLFGHDTEGGALSLDAAKREILLTRRLDVAETNGDTLYRAAQALARVTAEFKERIEELAARTSSAGTLAFMGGDDRLSNSLRA
jgi:hypothetical protein